MFHWWRPIHMRVGNMNTQSTLVPAYNVQHWWGTRKASSKISERFSCSLILATTLKPLSAKQERGMNLQQTAGGQYFMPYSNKCPHLNGVPWRENAENPIGNGSDTDWDPKLSPLKSHLVQFYKLRFWVNNRMHGLVQSGYPKLRLPDISWDTEKIVHGQFCV